MRSFYLCAAIVFGLFSCKNNPAEGPGVDLAALPTEAAKLQIPKLSKDVIRALKQKDSQALAQLTHPEKGLTFSPEVTVDSTNRIVMADEVKQLFGDQTTYFWGMEDGSGDSILLNFSDYYDQYLYDVDFLKPDRISFNQPNQYGNALNNLDKAYPGCVVSEYYVSGQDPKFEGLDWRALRMVFEPIGEEWYLVGIIHAAWTT